MAVEESHKKRPVKAFISYSHDSPTHENRVLSFATALGDHGIDVELDQFHTDEIVDWPRWCNEQTSRDHSDFVLCICTAEYCRCIDGNVCPEKGKGVYWEGSLLDDDIYDEKGNRRIVLVLFDDEPETSMPRFLRGWTFCRLHSFVLTDSGYTHVLRILTGQPRVAKKSLGRIPVLPAQSLPSENPAQTVAPTISSTRLRHGADSLVGREKELARLDAAWHDPKTHVVTIVAWGGVGKTALVVDWMARMAADDWCGAERVFDWPFYSQGTSETATAPSDAFVAKALEFFGDPETAQSPALPWDKGERLARLVADRRTLLVLDGVEPFQHSPGPVGGELKDPALEALLKGLARHNPGLCIVTTRERLADLAPFHKTTAPEWSLEHLSEEAGAKLLFDAGVDKAGNAHVEAVDQELKDATRAVGGHALTLQLLGRYLAKAYNGDVRKRSLVAFEKADAKVQGGHAFRMMAAYESWLGGTCEEGKKQLAVLHLLGLFDRPADAGCIAALREEPAIEGLTEPLIGLEDDDWNYTLSNLRECGLITTHGTNSLPISSHVSLDVHPLIREYFGKQLRKKSPHAWRQAHLRLYRYLRNSTPDQAKPTLDDLQPLYQAVMHGCLGGMQQRALTDVFRKRIWRESPESPLEFYSTRILGATGSELAALQYFFRKMWAEPSEELDVRSQALVLHAVGFRLRTLAEWDHATVALRAARDKYQLVEDWREAAECAGNLNEVCIARGDLAEAVGHARESVNLVYLADPCDAQWRRRAGYAHVLHVIGDWKSAEMEFREAERTLQSQAEDTKWLYSLAGYYYCEFLLERVGSLNPSDGQNCLQEVKARAELALRRAGDYHRDISLCNLVLGRAHLLMSASQTERARSLARTCLDTAVNDSRTAGRSDLLCAALLARAAMYERTGNSSCTKADLDNAWQIAERGSMRLFMADIHLCRARFFGPRQGETKYPWESPQADLAEARRLIEKCGYHRRDGELADAEEAAKGW